ncbi:diguanylate cyclase [Niveispirillum sp. KHB5.9]|uniref:diguanylate cyclase n=1 Tax=Niveispirillum sp. KHB5.9 TaxID=3400269 RepID=UPI003A8AA381
MSDQHLSVSVAARHREIRAQYVLLLPERLAALAHAASDAAEMLRQAHGLVGSASTFGFMDLAEAARRLEQVLRAPLPNAAAAATQLEQALAGVLGAGEQALHLPERVEDAEEVGPRAEELTVYLLEDDTVQADELVSQMRPYGYRAKAFTDPASFREAVRENPPSALIVDIICGADYDAGSETLTRMLAEGPVPPAIFLSGRDDFAARLGAVRAGGAGYLTKPVDPATLAERLDQAIGRESIRPYRVMLIDDDPLVAAQYATALGGAGMEVEVLVDPVEAIPQIRRFLPDLVLLDQVMPGCTGLELAAVLRQQEGMLSLPILFLTADQALGDKRLVLDVGAEDLLLKPIGTVQLVSQVRARVRRARQLQAMMARDSLTGALNHAMVQEHLATEVARARRDGVPLSFVMIDVDRFKRVNDEHGHAAGDRVLRSLARLLRQRLRRSDIVGRYGGEEFAVILPGTGPSEAAFMLDALRRDFQAIGFRGAGDVLFHVSFSAGVAGLTDASDLAALNLAADAALYFAKRAGRDRVHIAGSLSTPA